MNLTQAMWIITGLSLLGAVANIKRKRWCFHILAFTDALWCAYDYSIEAYAQSALFGVYFALAIWGMIEWREREEEDALKRRF